MTSSRLAYVDPDSTVVMTHDATACYAEDHLARARSTVQDVPGAVRRVLGSSVDVSEATAKFAARLFE